ncbi:MAG TPA: TonB-dependent receptor [Caulobacteraceae bacterium]|nr:TonB-dependent receptor [Caulobacteraceae bacterium]
MAVRKSLLLTTSMIAGLAVLAPSFAYAQDAAPSEEPAAEEAGEAEEEIVVTGSRIRRNEFTSPSPVQILTSEQATLEGMADTGELLQSSSLAAGSPQVNSIISSAFVTDGGPGAQTISLRGLGANRTLVLLNGRRAGPAGVRGGVSAFDLNVIPQSAIERIEILKDGASSVYGSDAVAGVVNIITKRNRDGGEISAYTSQPQEEGGAVYRLSGSWGRTFDRGHFSISGDYYKQEELKLGDRDYLNCSTDYTFDSATGLRNDRVDARTGEYACRDTLWGHIWLYNYGGDNVPPGGKLQYDPTGTLGTLVPGTNAFRTQANDAGDLRAPANWFLVDYTSGDEDLDRAVQGVANANHPFAQEASFIPEIERSTVYADASFDLGGGIEAYTEVLLNRRESRTNGFRQFWTYLFSEDFFTVYYGGGGGDPFSSGFSGAFIFSPTAITDHYDASQRVDYGRVVAGLRGEVPFGQFGDWDWDVFVQHSRSDGQYTQDVILNDAVDSAAFRSGSCVGTNLPVSGKPCIDINWLSPNFLAGDFTDAERAFLFDSETGNTLYTQSTFEGTMAGELWELPAGRIGAAIGFHIRRDEIEDTPGEITLADNSWGLSGAGITKGKDSTREVFGELELPIVRGQPLFESLTLNASGRHTFVESYGSNSTYKLGLNWQVTPAWRVRATQGTSFRAPALFELYLADQTSFLGQKSIDPCLNWGLNLANGDIPQELADNCAADGIPANHTGAGSSAEIVTGGGLGVLEAETSEAKSLGLIWTPDFIDLSVALDYYEVVVNDEVSQLGAANIVTLCYLSDNFPNDPLCDQFDRNPSTHLITEVRDQYINIASQDTRGIDLTLRYGHETPWGDLTLNGQFSWQLEDTIALFENNTVDSNGDIGDPDFVGNAEVRFDRGPWTVFWGMDFIGHASNGEDVNNVSSDGDDLYKIETEFMAYHDLSLRHRFDTWTLIGGVSNLFDEHPPAGTRGVGLFGTSGVSVLSSQYDYLGRRFFLNVSKRF